MKLTIVVCTLIGVIWTNNPSVVLAQATPPPGLTLPPGGIEWKNCIRPFEEYDCGIACQPECKRLGEPCPIINIRCTDDCYCIKGYARDYSGTCIPQSQCPQNKQQ